MASRSIASIPAMISPSVLQHEQWRSRRPNARWFDWLS